MGILGQLWPNFRQKMAKLDHLEPKSGSLKVKSILNTRDCAETRACLLSSILKLYLENFEPTFNLFFGQIRPWTATAWIFFHKIHTQLSNLCGKLVLFSSLGLLIRFWPFRVNFGPIMTKLGQIWCLRANIQYYYVKSTLTTWNCVEKWSCLAL